MIFFSFPWDFLQLQRTEYYITYLLLLNFTAYPVFQMRLTNLVVGNPSLLEVDAKDDWDEMDSYTLEFSVCSKHYKPVREDNSY